VRHDIRGRGVGDSGLELYIPRWTFIDGLVGRGGKITAGIH